ncbi:MAG: hypothetical protein WC260_00660 [Candidatus Pacearchaeota archaeon]
MNKKSIFFKNKNNLFLFISFLCFFILFFLIIYSNFNNSYKIIENKILRLFNQLNISFVIYNLEFLNDPSIYKSVIIINGSIKEIYFTSDGNKIIPFIYSVEDLLIEEGASLVNTSFSNFSEIDKEKIILFVNCLSSKGLKIYGLSNQEYTIYLAGIFGGFEIIEPIYIDCSENRITCLNENIMYYPSVKVKNNFVGVEASLDDFSRITGCDLEIKR